MLFEKKELETLLYLRDVVQAYEEIASIRMQKVKASVLSNRQFLDGIKRLVLIVRKSYEKELTGLTKRKKSKDMRVTNGRAVVVLLSANTGLYGDIVQKTYDSFLAYVKKHDVDVVIVGKVGYRMFQSSNIEKKAEFFEINDSFSDRENIEKLLRYILTYQSITVFHGKFKDLLVQDAELATITGEQIEQEINNNQQNVKETLYIFEPSLEKVMAYFEEEILSSMFKHTVHESGLSKYASRMISLERANERIGEKVGDFKLKYQKSRHRNQNRKQQNTLAGIYGRYN